MNALTSVGVGRAPWRKNRGGLEDLVGLAQLAHLALELLEALALGGRQAITSLAGVGLRLAHPLTQRLVLDAEIARHMRDRPAGLEDEADGALLQFVGILLR
jgi:hypothetical protein